MAAAAANDFSPTFQSREKQHAMFPAAPAAAENGFVGHQGSVRRRGPRRNCYRTPGTGLKKAGLNS